jgi:hypothetical protein
MTTNNINYTTPEDARNFNKDDYYMFAFAIYNHNKIRMFILPEYKFDQKFRQNNNVGMCWKKKFITIEEAKKELPNFVYDELVIIEYD